MNQLLRIAVLDDDCDDFLLLEELIEDCYGDKCALTHCKHPDELYDFLGKNKVALCFIDYKLGATLGTDVIIGLGLTYPELPCILLTGLKDPDIDVEASQAGAYEYLPKEDLNATLLERTIRYVLRNAEQRNQLYEERRRLERVIEHSPYPMMLFDESGRIRIYSASLISLGGYDIDSLSTINEWIDLVIGERRDDVADFKADLIQATGGTSYDYRICHADGHMMLWRFKTVEIGLSSQGERLFVAMASDITKLTDAIKRAEAANNAKSDFLSVISHELRTPLNPILGLTEIIKEETDCSDTLEMIRIIQESGEGLLRLIQDLLDYTSSDLVNFELAEEPFELKAVIEYCVQAQTLDFENKRLSLKLDISSEYLNGGDINYLGDAGRIQQVILNLLNNAQKFTSKGGVTIRVNRNTTSNSRHIIKIEVTDTGIGIDECVQQKVFDPLFQVDGSNTRSQSGTGLGLAISKRLVQQMEGEINLKSELGVGTTLTISLPLKLAESETELARINTLVSKAHLSGRILVAEDVKENMDYIRRILSRNGLDIVEASNGEEALRAFESDPESFDLVLMDLQMPVCDGFEATRLLRNREDSGKHIPIIAVTANVRADVETACRAVGMNDFITKPYTPKQLDNVLNKYLNGEFIQPN